MPAVHRIRKMRYHPGWTGTPKAEKAKKNAKDRRDKENDGLEKLKKVLPLSSNVISTLDKLSTMRLSVAYLWLKKKLEEEKESACLDANGNTCSTAVQSNDLASRMLQGHELLKCFDSFLIYVHKNGQIAYVSEQVEDYLGFKQTAMIGKHIFEFVLEQDHRELRKQFIVKPYKKTESNGTTITTYCQNREFCVHMNCQIIDKEKNSKSRGQLMVQWTGRLKIKNSLKPAGLICMCRPIYGDPMMEIRTQGNAFSSHHSLDLKYVDVDPRVTQLLGYEREDLIGKPVYLFHFPLDAKTISECHQTLIAVGKTVSKYYRFLSKSGDWVWVQSKATILYNSNSQPQSVVCVSQLISEAEVKRSLASENKKAIEYAVPGANLTELTATSSGRDTNQSGFAGQNGSVDSTPVSNTRKQPLPSSDSQSSTSSLSSRDSESDAQPVFKKPRLDKMNVRTQSMLMSPEVDFAVVDDVFKIGMPLEEPLPPFCSDTETNLESPGGYLSDANSDNSMGFDVPSGKRSSKQRDNNPYMSYDSPGINFSSTSTGETSLNSNSVSSDAFSSFGPYRSCTSSTPSPTLNALNQTNSQLYLAKTNTITANTSSQDDNQPSELRRLLLEGRQKKKQKSDSSVRKSDQQLEAEKPVLASLLQGKLDLSKAHIPAPVVNDQPRQQQKQKGIHSQRTVHSSIGDGLGKDNFNDFGNTSSQGFQNINTTNHPSQSWSPVDMSLLDSMETLLDQENLLVDYYYSSLLMNDEIPPEPSTTGQQCVQQSSDSASPPMSTHSLQSPQGSLFGSPQGPAQQNYGSSNSPLMSPQGWAQMSPGGTVISNQVPNVNMQVPTSPSLQRSSKYSSQGSCSSSSSSVHSAMSPPGLQTLRSPYSSQACSPSPTRSRHSTGGGSLSEEICDEIFAGSSPPSVPHIVAPAGRPLQGSSGQVVDINFGDPLLSDTSLHGQESQESFESDVMAFEELLRSSSPHSQASSACEGVEEVVRGFINSPWSQENPDKLIINSVNGPSLKKLLHC